MAGLVSKRTRRAICPAGVRGIWSTLCRIMDARILDADILNARIIPPAWKGFQTPTGISDFRVVERLEGNATTDFGTPGMTPSADYAPLAGS